MNPARDSKWRHLLPTGWERFSVCGIWGKGFSHTYEVTVYELKYAHQDKITYMEVAKMNELITLELIKPI